MSNVENQLARAEAIIEALITENRLLKARNALLEKAGANQQDFVSNVKSDGGYTEDFVSTTKSGDGLPELLKSNVQSKDGFTEDSVSIPKSEDGFTELWKSNHKSDSGHKEDFVSIPKSWNGYTELWKSKPEIESGYAMDFVSILKNEDGSPIDFNDHQKIKLLLQKLIAERQQSGEGNKTSRPELPQFIDPNLYPSVVKMLKEAGIKGVSKNFLKCIAKLIIHFHNCSPSDYPTLMKLTGLSRGGLTKNMMSMRKRGMMVKTGFQRYGITEWSKGILLKVVLKMG